MAGQVTIRGFQIGELKVECDAPAGMSLRDVLAAAGVHMEGQTFIVNGQRVPEAGTGQVNLRGGDQVEVLNKARGGVVRILVVGR
jgi:sulfur carrier protein ThiS